jgi:antitoxin component of MazEF toxin-antitoxin module
MKFRATIELDGKTATGIRVPEEVMTALGSGKRPAVKVTIGEHTYRTTVGTMGGIAKIPISADNRKKAGVEAGDKVDLEIELDTAPREVDVPADLAESLARDDAAKTFFEGLTPSQKKAYVTWVESAKKAETRERRVAEATQALREGRARR